MMRLGFAAALVGVCLACRSGAGGGGGRPSQAAAPQASAPVAKPQLFLDAQFPVVRISDVVFGKGEVRLPAPGERDLTLDVYQPQGPGLPERLPTCIFIFGGYFFAPGKYMNGHDFDGDGIIDHTTVDQYARDFARRGYLCICIDYRLLGEDPVVAPENKAFMAAAGFEDARKAYAWLIANADKYSVDLSRVAIGGHSAGGEIAMLNGYVKPGGPSFFSPGPLPVRAVFSLSGSMFALYVHWFASGDPPFFLFHGTWDSFLPKHVPDCVAQRAARAGMDFQYWRQEKEDHFYLMSVNVQGKPLQRRLLEFLYEKMDLASVTPLAAVKGAAWTRYED